MLALVLGAVRTRTAQVTTILVLTAVAAAAAAAGPWYGIAAAARAAAADVAAAPAAQRVLSVRRLATTNGDPAGALTAFERAVRDILPIRGGAPVLGMKQDMTVPLGAGTEDVAVAYRAGFCAHVRLAGACPSAAGDVALSENAAQLLGAGIGDRIAVRASPSTEPVRLRIVGRYELTDPAGGYWSDALFRANGGLDPLFTPMSTFTDRQLWSPTMAFDTRVPDDVIRGDTELAGALAVADARFDAAQLRLVDPTAAILETIARDRATITDGVAVALGQVVVLAWFAIGLAGRYTGRDRHRDAALLKLRGSTRGAALGLALGQHAVPMLAGAVLGAPLGYLAAWALSGTATGYGRAGTALALGAAAVGAVLLGGLWPRCCGGCRPAGVAGGPAWPTWRCSRSPRRRSTRPAPADRPAGSPWSRRCSWRSRPGCCWPGRWPGSRTPPAPWRCAPGGCGSGSPRSSCPGSPAATASSRSSWSRWRCSPSRPAGSPPHARPARTGPRWSSGRPGC
jgi:hypothetical protein